MPREWSSGKWHHGLSNERSEMWLGIQGVGVRAGVAWSQKFRVLAISLTYTTAHSYTRSFNPLSKARGQTCVLMDTSHICYCWTITGTPVMLCFCGKQDCWDLLALNLAAVTFITHFEKKIHSPLVMSLTCVLFETIMNEASGNIFCKSFCAYIFSFLLVKTGW